MPFIGIIAKESDSNFIKNKITKSSKKTNFEVININKKSIDNIKNIRFETIVINDEIKELLNNSKYLEEIIKKAKYLIINSDIIDNLDFLSFFVNNTTNIITYGLNKKATVTISSIKSENILICVQKSFKDVKNKHIEEQEFKIEMKKNNLKKICNSLAIFAILTIYGENLQKI